MDSQLRQLLASGSPGIVLNISAKDLKEVVMAMVHDEQQRIKEAIERHREEPVLTRKDVMSILGVSECTLIEWAKTDYLVPVKIGRKVMYRPSDVNAILYK